MKKLGILLSYLLSTIFFMANIGEACEFVDVCSNCAYTTIQDAVNYVECADNNYNYTIRIAEGTYYENISITKCSSSATGAKNITIEGGWNESFTVHDSQQHNTIVDGDNYQALDRRVFVIDPEESDLTLMIKDLIVRKGLSDGNYGGGIGAETKHNYNLFLTLINNIIQYNHAGVDAGGISIRSFKGNIEATLKNNKIHGNSADWDTGGILINPWEGDITLTMQDNEIFDNTALFGAGIFFYSNLTTTEGKIIADLSNNFISGNYVSECLGLGRFPVTDGGGIGIYVGNDHAMEMTLNNNIIENNQAAFGAGISVIVATKHADDKAQVRLMSKNNTITDNIIPNGTKGTDCTDLIYGPDEYIVTGGGVAMNIDKYLTKQSVFTFDNDTITGNSLDDLVLETGDRGKAFIDIKNSTINKMTKYSERSGQKVTYEGDLVPDIAADDFNDGNDNGWTQKSGTWTVENGVENGEYCETIASGETPAFSLINLQTQDMTLEVKGIDRGTGGYKNFFIVFAYDEANAKAYWAGAKVGIGKWTIEETDLSTGESWPPLAESPVENIETNTWYDLKVEVNGNTVTLYAKKETETDYGNLKVTYTFNDPVRFPNGIPMGDVGLGGRNNHAHFDDFTLTLLLPVANPGAPLTGSPVRIMGSSTEYKSLQDAYDAAGNGNIIQSQATRFMEDLDIDINKSVTLEGGYNCDYTAVNGKTTLNGTMTISNGTVTVGNFVLE